MLTLLRLGIIICKYYIFVHSHCAWYLTYIAEILLVSDVVLSVFLIVCINGIHCVFLLSSLMLLLIHSSCSVVFFMCIQIFTVQFFLLRGVPNTQYSWFGSCLF